MKTAWIFQGGWDGHEPRLVSRRFQRLLEKNGYKAEIFDTLDPMADLEALKALDLIVPCWTMGAIPSEYTKNVSIAVGRIPSGSSSPAGSGCPTPAETAFTTP